jgi:hypothetical protein
MHTILPKLSNAGPPLIPPDNNVSSCIAVQPVPSGEIVPRTSYKPPILAANATGFVTSVNSVFSDRAPGKPPLQNDRVMLIRQKGSTVQSFKAFTDAHTR